MIKVATTGASGLIGSRVIELLSGQFEFINFRVEELDITNSKAVEETLSKTDFDVFLHLAGYTNVDLAETQKEIAYAINVKGTENVFSAVAKKNKKFIYISTDFVFDGSNPPYDENSVPNPKTYYGQTKFDGENLLRDQAMIVRLSYPYRATYEPKRDIVRSIKYALENKKPLAMVTDSFITPTFIDDIAFCFKYLFEHFSPTLYHIVGKNSVSPYEAARLIAKNWGLDQALISPTTHAEYAKNKAPRPQYSVITSLRNTFHKMKTFEEGLSQIKKSEGSL